MNVNYQQQSAIKKELRQRRAAFQNQQTNSIKPFMSHRKPKNDPTQQMQLISCSNYKLNVGKENQDKYKRQYKYKDTILQVQKQASTEGKFKYSIEQKENQMIQEKRNFKIKTNADRITQAKKLLQKYNTQKKPSSLRYGLNGKRKEVQSIIFDSKVRKFEQKTPEKSQGLIKMNSKNTQQHLLLFQQKASQINSDIEAGLSNIEQLLKEAKKKKHQKSQIKVQPQKNIRIDNLQREFTDRRNYFKVQQLVSNPRQIVQRQQKQTSKNPVESQIQLQGDFKNKSEIFPAEYISFINRLSKQIEKDIDFTNKIQELTKCNQINQVKKLILNEDSQYMTNQIHIDQSFFKIQQAQIDPLQESSNNTYKKLSQQELQNQAHNLFQMYKDIQTYFNTKLYKKNSPQTIKLLFQQLSRFNFTKTTGDSSHVTIGHLLSYLNMRTNKCFRNRSFIKMLKRLSLKPNSLLAIQSFALFTG